MQPDDIDKPAGSGIEISFQCPCGHRCDIDVHIGADVAFTCGSCGEPYEIKTISVARGDEHRDTAEPAVGRGCLIIPESLLEERARLDELAWTAEAAICEPGVVDLLNSPLPVIIVDPFLRPAVT